MNTLYLAGHLGADPEVRYTSSGQKVTLLRVAAKARRSGKDETIWWRVTIWGEQFDKMLAHLKKGSAVIVIGDLAKPEIYTDREGNPQVSMNVTATSVHFSPFGRTERDTAMTQNAPPKPVQQEQSAAPAPAAAAMDSNSMESMPSSVGSNSFDDEVPF